MRCSHHNLAGLLLLLAACGPAQPPAPPVARETPPARMTTLPARPALTPAEQAVQQRLRKQLAANRPTHRLYLRDGRILEGQLLAESPASIRFRERLGFSGQITASHDRAAIERIEPMVPFDVVVSDDDARLAAEFPTFHFLKAPPYSLVTDESPGEAERALRILAELRRQFTDHFAALIEPVTNLSVQVILFAREDSYRHYVRRTAPGLANSAGFFRHADHRLVLLHPRGTRQYTELQTRLTDRLHLAAAEPRARQHLAAWRSQVASEARSLHERLLRHEGAHQLFHAHRLHSAAGVEPTWLTEGLAQYCETPVIGRYHMALANRLTAARRAGTLLALRELLNHRAADGFFDLGEDRVEIAYAQSWALVYWLMREPHRDRFYRLLQEYRQASHFEPQPAETLAQCLGIPFAELEHRWQAFLDRL